MSITDQIADVSVTATTVTQTRQGFGTALLAVVLVPWTEGARVRSFGSLSAMRDAGFSSDTPAYQMASAMLAQNPAPSRVKVGRRASAFTQVVHLTPDTPVASEVFSAKVDGLSVSATADGTPTLAEVCTALAASINALAAPAAIIATGGSTGGSQTITGAGLNGTVGGGVISPPRALSLTLSSSGDWMATTATVTGKDVDGRVITDTFAIPNGGDDTVFGASGKHFAKVTSVAIPAQDGTAGTFTLGTRAPVTAVATGGTHVVCTAPVAGELHSFELVTGNVTLGDHTADPGIAADLAAMQVADGDFYGLCLDSNSAAEVAAAAAWAESHKRLFGYQTADSACGDPGDSSDVMSVLKGHAYAYSFGFFYPALGLADGWVAAAALGQHLTTAPGSATLAFKTLRGILLRSVSDAFVAAIITTPDSTGKNGNCYLDLGQPGTFPGMVAAGEWIDVVRGLDWLRARMKERILAVQFANPKIAYTDNGIDLIRAQVVAQLKEGIGADLLAPAPKFSVTTPTASSTSSADRSARRLPGVTFSAPLSGAILYTGVAGVASI